MAQGVTVRHLFLTLKAENARERRFPLNLQHASSSSSSSSSFYLLKNTSAIATISAHIEQDRKALIEHQ